MAATTVLQNKKLWQRFIWNPGDLNFESSHITIKCETITHDDGGQCFFLYQWIDYILFYCLINYVSNELLLGVVLMLIQMIFE